MDIVWIIFYQFIICIAVAGVCWYVKIRTKLVYGNEMYVFTDITIVEQILKIRNTTRPHNKPG